MDTILKQTIEQSVAASHAGSLPFGELVALLAQHGVESYRVDYRLGEMSYYLPSGETHTVSMPEPALAVGDRFEEGAIVEAIRASQRGEQRYPQFVERTTRAGCVGYTVWIAGRHVTYFGRRGEMHVERFPGTN